MTGNTGDNEEPLGGSIGRARALRTGCPGFETRSGVKEIPGITDKGYYSVNP